MTVAGDVLDEIDESFTLNLSNPVNATISDPIGLGTITDNDALPTLSVNDVTVTEGNTGTVAATFAVTLNTPSGRAVSVDYATANGTATSPADYAAASATLNFAAGQITKQVTVQVNGDALDEVNETYFVNLTNASNATITDGSGVGTITDDDPVPTLSIGDRTVTEGDSGTVDATFTVTLSTVSGRTVTVDYATANGTATSPADYTAVALATLTFNPGQTTRTVTVSVNGDVFDEPDETFNVNLSGAVGATIADSNGCRHDHGRRPAACAQHQRRHGHRGQHRDHDRKLHRQPELAERPNRERPVRHRERYGDRTGRLCGRHRHGHVHTGPVDEDDRDPGCGRHDRRDHRDLFRQPLERDERDNRGCTGSRHDHRRRRCAGALRERRHGHRRPERDSQRDLHGLPVGGERAAR